MMKKEIKNLQNDGIIEKIFEILWHPDSIFKSCNNNKCLIIYSNV